MMSRRPATVNSGPNLDPELGHFHYEPKKTARRFPGQLLWRRIVSTVTGKPVTGGRGYHPSRGAQWSSGEKFIATVVCGAIIYFLWQEILFGVPRDPLAGKRGAVTSESLCAAATFHPHSNDSYVTVSNIYILSDKLRMYPCGMMLEKEVDDTGELDIHTEVLAGKEGESGRLGGRVELAEGGKGPVDVPVARQSLLVAVTSPPWPYSTRTALNLAATMGLVGAHSGERQTTPGTGTKRSDKRRRRKATGGTDGAEFDCALVVPTDVPPEIFRIDRPDSDDGNSASDVDEGQMDQADGSMKGEGGDGMVSFAARLYRQRKWKKQQRQAAELYAEALRQQHWCSSVTVLPDEKKKDHQVVRYRRAVLYSGPHMSEEEVLDLLYGEDFFASSGAKGEDGEWIGANRKRLEGAIRGVVPPAPLTIEGLLVLPDRPRPSLQDKREVPGVALVVRESFNGEEGREKMALANPAALAMSLSQIGFEPEVISLDAGAADISQLSSLLGKTALLVGSQPALDSWWGLQFMLPRKAFVLTLQPPLAVATAPMAAVPHQMPPPRPGANPSRPVAKGLGLKTLTYRQPAAAYKDESNNGDAGLADIDVDSFAAVAQLALPATADEKYLIFMPWQNLDHQETAFKSACGAASILDRRLVLPPFGWRKVFGAEPEPEDPSEKFKFKRGARVFDTFKPSDFQWDPMERYYDEVALYSLPCKTVTMENFKMVHGKEVGKVRLNKITDFEDEVQIKQYFQNVEGLAIDGINEEDGRFFQMPGKFIHKAYKDLQDPVLAIGAMFWYMRFGPKFEFPLEKYLDYMSNDLYKQITDNLDFKEEYLVTAESALKQKGLTDFVALHLRRGEFDKKCGIMEPALKARCWPEAEDIMKPLLKLANKDTTLYISTTDPDHSDFEFLEEFFGSIYYSEDLLEGVNERNNIIEARIMDVVICSAASHFVGNLYSPLTRMVVERRDLESKPSEVF